MNFLKDKVKYVFFGLISGICNGLFGSGGGMIVVPFLEKNGLCAHKAHATAIAIILPLAVVSMFRYMTFCKVSANILGVICLGGIIGSFVGAKMLRRFSDLKLRRVFALFIILAAVRMVMG